MVATKAIELIHVPTTEQRADILTVSKKCVPLEHFPQPISVLFVKSADDTLGSWQAD